ncbi:30 kDa salivary gland allergen Aed a 3-like [Brassica napus]|uniref:(rape) hypothetical protein n=1 Tax=Brassica napus TaxID=3708 RepID=A0A816ZFZ4_BRANA|nr:30 kDa salivary gland allergen Aed a 3-like [Brassica napus]CAF2191796.1 unnamed protein product [Brassica napus]
MRRVIMKLEGRGFGGRPLVTARPPTPDGRTREERRTDREMWRQGFRGDKDELSDWSSEDEDDDEEDGGDEEGGEKEGGEKDGGEQDGGEKDGGEKDGGEQDGGEKDGGEQDDDKAPKK